MMEVEIEQIQECIPKYGYEFEKLLDYGTSSSVSLCKGIQNQQHFAIKRSNKQTTTNEFDALVSLNHPNIISLYNAFEDEESKYLVMEYCSNGTIREKGKLSTEKFIHYSKQILDAIAYCHANKTAHRDLNPHNIFIDQYDNIKVGEFVTAKQFDTKKKLKEQSKYMLFSAPEILQHKKYDPFKADIWSLGITFFFMAVGFYPFKNKNVEDLRRAIIYGELDFGNVKINPQVRFLINKMLTKNPEARPTAEKLLKLPVFNSNENAKKNNFLAGSRRNSCTLGSSANFFLNKSMTFDTSTESDDATQVDDKNPIPLSEVHCYRSVAIHPSSNHFCLLHQPARI